MNSLISSSSSFSSLVLPLASFDSQIYKMTVNKVQCTSGYYNTTPFTDFRPHYHLCCALGSMT